MTTYQITNHLEDVIKTVKVNSEQEVQDIIFDLKSYHGFYMQFNYNEVLDDKKEKLDTINFNEFFISETVFSEERNRNMILPKKIGTRKTKIYELICNNRSTYYYNASLRLQASKALEEKKYFSDVIYEQFMGYEIATKLFI